MPSIHFRKVLNTFGKKGLPSRSCLVMPHSLIAGIVTIKRKVRTNEGRKYQTVIIEENYTVVRRYGFVFKWQ